MKFAFVVAFLACAVFVQSQVLPPAVGVPPVGVPPVAPALAGPLAAGPLGPLGLPGLPIIPPIIPPFLGFPFFRPFFGFRRFGLFGGFGFPFFGKRDTEDVEKMETKAEDARAVEKVVEEKKKVVAEFIPEPIVKCVVSSVDKIIRCDGSAKHTIKCPVKPHIESLGAVELKIDNLDIIEQEKETNVFSLVVPKTKITAQNPKTKEDIVVSIWNGEQTHKLVGFEVTESSCWSQVKTLVGDLRPEELAVRLVIA